MAGRRGILRLERQPPLLGELMNRRDFNFLVIGGNAVLVVVNIRADSEWGVFLAMGAIVCAAMAIVTGHHR